MGLKQLRKDCDRLRNLNQKNQSEQSCILWHPDRGFRPNPGAQEQLFRDHVSLSPDRANPSSHRWIYYRGGIGSGKSFSGAAFIVANAKRDRDARQLITANSYGQLRTSTLVALAEFCKRFGVPLDPIAEVDLSAPEWADRTAERIARHHFCTVFGAPVLCLSVESFTGRTERSSEVGRGLQVRGIWADEIAYAERSAFVTMSGRLGRGPGTMKGLALFTSSINKNDPYNWIFDLFDSPDRTEDQRRLFVSIRGSSRENLYADRDFVDSVASGLTNELIALELEGEYATVAIGLIAQYFKRSRHLLAYPPVIDPLHPVHLSIDFNFSPSCAIACQFINDRLIVLREWYLPNAGTFELSSAIAQWCAGHQLKDVQLHGDASGNQRTANSRKTNWQIVKESLTAIGFRTHYKLANPNVIDTINATNVGFKNDRIEIEANCKELIKDLESLQFDSKNGIDKSDSARSHLFDCLRYVVHDLMPIALPVKRTIVLPASYSAI